jgi:hypothetical protein
MIRELQSSSEFQFPGVPLAELGGEAPIPDHRPDNRMEPRVPCRGKIRFTQQNGAVVFRGQLVDISANGFRVSFANAKKVPAAGTEVEFKHAFFRGRARLIWILRKENDYEAGCRVLRD